MKTKKVNEAKKILEELRQSIAKKPTPFIGMTKEQVIQQLRKIREKLWEEKLAARS